ncbi:hypothetical protein ES705_41482 [subsurface metagenome]
MVSQKSFTAFEVGTLASESTVKVVSVATPASSITPVASFVFTRFPTVKVPVLVTSSTNMALIFASLSTVGSTSVATLVSA